MDIALSQYFRIPHICTTKSLAYHIQYLDECIGCHKSVCVSQLPEAMCRPLTEPRRKVQLIYDACPGNEGIQEESLGGGKVGKGGGREGDSQTE